MHNERSKRTMSLLVRSDAQESTHHLAQGGFALALDIALALALALSLALALAVAVAW